MVKAGLIVTLGVNKVIGLYVVYRTFGHRQYLIQMNIVPAIKSTKADIYCTSIQQIIGCILRIRLK